VNTFFKCGGRFDPEFDLFNVATPRAEDLVRSKIDVFDHVDGTYRPGIRTRPDRRWAFGIDHKKTLLEKAARLHFYDELLLSDLRDDAREIEDASLDFAYCNSLYWVEDSPGAARHIMRKVKPGGYAVFDVMTTGRKKLQFQNLFPALPSDWHDLMNRGRDLNNPGIRTERQWTETFAGVGVVEDVRLIFPQAVAMAWNIGLRPLFPMLKKMSDALTPETRAEIKAEWIEIVAQAAAPLLLEPQEFGPEVLRARLQYVVRAR
jgi:SAM-dependent methyltransferase